MARFQTHYKEVIIPLLQKERQYSTPMEVPRITKITINMGVGEAIADKKIMDYAVSDLAKISGQNPIRVKARKSVAAFKVREGNLIGCKVTLRGLRMYEFLDRLISIALPRVRDFRGMSCSSFDGRGNYNLGIKEQTIFPEIEYGQTSASFGMNIAITTTAKTNQEAHALLSAFKFPFKAWGE